MRKLLIAGAMALAWLIGAVAPASAQNTTGLVLTTCGSPVVAFRAGNPGPFTVDVNGNLCVSATITPSGTQNVNLTQINGQAVSVGNGAVASGTLRVVQASDSLAVPSAGAMTTAGCSVGTSSALCLAAVSATRWIQVQNTHASNTIACAWGGTAALNASSSFMLQPGQSASWGPSSGGVPANALNCIASAAATPLYVEYR